MIIFDLICICGCQFEGWFQHHEDYARQHDQGMLLCPQCGSYEIKKILSPVAVRTRGAGVVGQGPPAVDSDIAESAMQRALAAVQHYVEKNFEDVGSSLAEKTMKMLYGVEEPKNIRGVATPLEEKMLKKEGVELLKIPMPTKKDPAN